MEEGLGAGAPDGLREQQERSDIGAPGALPWSEATLREQLVPWGGGFGGSPPITGKSVVADRRA